MILNIYGIFLFWSFGSPLLRPMPSRHYTRSIIPCKSVLSLVDRTPLPRRGVPPPFRTFPESISRSRPKSFASTHSLWYKLRAFCRVTRSFSSSSLAFNPQAAVGKVTDRTVTSYVESQEIDARELPSVPVALVDASEGEWLQDEREDDSRSICTPDPPQVRLDWRLRASSRVKKENKSDQEKRRHPRRKRLDGLNLDPDEPYYRSFEAYRSKSVIFILNHLKSPCLISSSGSYISSVAKKRKNRLLSNTVCRLGEFLV